MAEEAPAEACFEEATTADLPPLPEDLSAGLLVDVLLEGVLDSLGVAGNFRRSFWRLLLSPPLLHGS